MKNASMEYVCFDEKYIWFSDAEYGGLFCVDKSNKEIISYLNARVFDKNSVSGKAELLKINDKIFSVPAYSNGCWGIYDTTTRKMENVFRDVMPYELCGAIKKGKNIITIPIKTKNPIEILCSDDLSCECKMDGWWTKDKNSHSVWSYLMYKECLYIPIRDTNFIFLLFENNNPSFIELPKNVRISDASVYDNHIWILPIEGDKLYKYELSSGETRSYLIKRHLKLCNYIRIIATAKYVFLLPISENKILVLDLHDGNLIEIPESEQLSKKFTRNSLKLSYYNYYLEHDAIHFLPLKQKWIAFDFNTKSSRLFDCCFSDDSNYCYNNEDYIFYNTIRKPIENLGSEKTRYDLEAFIKKI